MPRYASFETASHTNPNPNKEYVTVPQRLFITNTIVIAKKLLYGAQDLVLTSPGNSLMGCVVHVPAAPTPATFSAATDTLS